MITTSFRNEKFENALNLIPQAVPPIWFMRQAGRYHSHYRKLKETYSFMDLCKQPELAAEVALGPVKEFGFDVSILFSDLLFPLEALGMGLTYDPGPKLSFSLTSENDLKRLKSPEEAIEGLKFQKEAVIRTREVLPKDVSLIGFVGGPFTLMTYASIGKHDGNLSFIKTNQNFVDKFYATLLPLLKQNIELQLQGGAEVVMIFDTAAGMLDPYNFNRYVTEPISEFAKMFPKQIGYYAKNSTEEHAKQIHEINNLAGFGVDHRFSIQDTLKTFGGKGFIQGNFDQELLFADPTTLKQKIREYLLPIKDLDSEERKGWVAGLGHGVLQFTPETSIHLLIDETRKVFSE
ncbi:uroporphyrinogen decarboxylase [Leptospira bourretii]|uniref:Uroporphyrinogen decarboxylase n=1 Tax=Leptospira bourretii TaxID=2484962 RepID=A0A4R9INW7_9LEPT|nr:uroporphyrinogen decarboxylase family protein [Leptospira bourretii]TGK85170.1 uroporphyrinogen decarboxylase [Leptospira bourretii]TGK90934.1 uroporphyrinogen decarboxylase [Leptospira bourretii]TGL23325.1 uroporphyrinogen decarboxylase [Leptospira bourretii]TGL30809.1 uroporphyrinogen decarboxylase [Leptospira bourretii]